MSDRLCKKCRKNVQPSALELIEQMRDRLWELEEKKVYKIPREDKQLIDVTFDKYAKLVDYFLSCEYKMGLLCDQIDRMKHE
jgi:hypothetical protein